MHALAGGQADHFLAELAQEYALAGDFGIRGSDADDVAPAGIALEAEEQVGRREMEEMQGMRLQDLAVMHQAAQLLGARRQPLCADHAVERLGRRQMVRHRADAAQPLHHHRHFPVRPTLDELLEAAEFDDVQAHLLHLIVLVEQQGNLAVPLDT
jgi:hypothetical protein